MISVKKVNNEQAEVKVEGNSLEICKELCILIKNITEDDIIQKTAPLVIKQLVECLDKISRVIVYVNYMIEELNDK